MSAFRCIIVDDEALARASLRRLVEDDDRLELIAEASNGTQALHLINELQPELVFLDIQMPGATGLDVARELKGSCHVIFTTAFDQHAVTAFELQAQDYLLKPFGRRRFDAAITRLEKDAVQPPADLDNAMGTNVLKQLFVRDRGRRLRVDIESIAVIQGADDYAELVTSTGKYLVSVRLKDLEERLDPTIFLRIHRSIIINLSKVRETAPNGNGRWNVVMEDGTELTTSRSGAAQLREAIGTRSAR